MWYKQLSYGIQISYYLPEVAVGSQIQSKKVRKNYTERPLVMTYLSGTVLLRERETRLNYSYQVPLVRSDIALHLGIMLCLKDL